jgi:hypothetical protein
VKNHGCTPIPDSEDLTVLGVRAVLLTTSWAGQPVARVIFVMDDQGLVFAQLLSGGGAAVDQLVHRVQAMQ